MAAQDIRNFFRQKKESFESSGIDWDAKKTAWIQAIESLYKTIVEQYLAAPISDGTLVPSYEETRIVESNIGIYIAPVLVLSVGDERVVFLPKGTNIVGATGRIDLRGDMGEVTIVHMPGRWGLVNRTQTTKVVPLDEESLLAALKSVMRK